MKADEIIKKGFHCLDDMCDADPFYTCRSCEEAFARGYEMSQAQQSKYRWHDLRKDPEDLPKETGLYLVFGEIPHLIPPYDCEMEIGYRVSVFAEFRDGRHWSNDICDELVIAWREIEEFEGSES